LRLLESGYAVNNLPVVEIDYSNGVVAELRDKTVVREHSHAIRSGLELTVGLMRELDVCTSRNDKLLKAIASVKDQKQRFAAQRAVSLPVRAAVMRDLAQSARLWIQLERQAFRISDDRDRNTVSAIDEMTEEELEVSLLEDIRILNLKPYQEP